MLVSMLDSSASLADPLLHDHVLRSLRCSRKALMLLCPLAALCCVLLWSGGTEQHLAVHKPITTVAWQSTASRAMRPIQHWQSMQPLSIRQHVSSSTGRFGPAYARAQSKQEEEMVGADEQALLQPDIFSRRGALLASAFAFGSGAVPTLPASAVPAIKVKTYLPESTVAPGLFEFSSGQKKTANLRAQVVYPYSFALPGDWYEQGVANAISGSYCIPKCGDQTTEVKFGNPKQGDLNVIIVPTIKLRINQKLPKLEDIGDPQAVIQAIGQSITNSVNIEPEEVISADILENEGQKYYVYNLNTPYAVSGTHNVAVVTVNRNHVIILCIASNESQWGAAKKDLMKITSSFRVASQFEANKA
eukprot:gnl/TRDRNA2_/TRDRNA2_32801_c0_seq1.p1 gnl/TRDRNA2_/TRDRNA2_32801_c0~~gnl/TRDRNA2_/TRDRNA2_32801_c0_seq1.p1  ORF type:complete len:361 (-),score=27.24 gnl/TRDRNA2_/TRDRNA2_32801_c0_seq1:133-1215(-)